MEGVDELREQHSLEDDGLQFDPDTLAA